MDVGVPEAEVPEFIRPEKWTEYFPAICHNDLKRFGARIDWRRSFITTELNPMYNSFIEW